MKERLLAFLGERSLRSVALRSGIEPSKLHRQLSNELKVQTIVQICRAYDAPMLAAFALVGFITEEEADSLAVDAALRHASKRQLAEEILTRVIDDDEREAPVREKAGTVTHLRPVAAPETNADGDFELASADDVERALQLPHAAKRGTRKADQEPFAE